MAEQPNTGVAFDPVAAWRYTPAVVSRNPADRDFRLDAKAFESIEWPAYSKNAPAKLVTYTDAEKQAQRQAGVRLQQQVAQAVAQKADTLNIEPGVYRFPDKSIPIDLSGVEGLTILGNGAELILEGFQRAFNLVECRNVILVGFTVDRDPYRHTQFTVLNHDWDAHEMTVRVMDGYEPENAPASGDIQFFADDGTWRRQVFTHYTKFTWIDKAQRIGVYSGVNPVELGVKEWLVGTLGATTLHGGYTVMYMIRCGACHFVDIVNYGGGMMISGYDNDGTCHFLRNKDMTRPGTSSLIAGGWGLMPFLGGGAIVEDGVYGRTNDDGVDVLAWNSALYQQEAPNVLVAATMTECPFRVGDTVRLYKQNVGTWLGEATVTAIDLIEDAEEIARAKKTFSKEGRWLDLGNQKHLVRLTLDKAFELETGDVIENYSAFRPEVFELRGTLFHDIFCRILIQGPKKTVVENSVFLRTGLPALMLCNEMFGFSEGKTIENVVIRGNTICDSPWSQFIAYGSGVLTGAIAIGVEDYGSNAKNLTKPFRHITIEDNWIIRPNLSGIQVKNVDGLVIRGNRIDSPVTKAGLTDKHPAHPGQGFYGVEQDMAIFLSACANITLEDNDIRMSDEAHCKREVLLLGCE